MNVFVLHWNKEHDLTDEIHSAIKRADELSVDDGYDGGNYYEPKHNVFGMHEFIGTEKGVDYLRETLASLSIETTTITHDEFVSYYENFEAKMNNAHTRSYYGLDGECPRCHGGGCPQCEPQCYV